MKLSNKDRDARQRHRDRVETLQRIAVCAGYLPPVELGPSEYPTPPAVRNPPRGPDNPRRGRPAGPDMTEAQ
eukprot:1650137-Alexandrium_andersonii.AAC.1